MKKTILKNTSFPLLERSKPQTISRAEVSPIVNVPLQNRSTLYQIKDSTIPSLVQYINNIKELNKEVKKGYKQRVKGSLKETNTVIQYLQLPSSLKNLSANPTPSTSFLPSLSTLPGEEGLGSAGKSTLLNSKSKSSLLDRAGIEIKKKILDIKNNTQSFITFSKTLFHYDYFTINSRTKYYLEDQIIFLLNNIKNKKQKYFFVKLLKKLKNKKNYKKINKKNYKNNYKNKFNNRTLVFSLRLNQIWQALNYQTKKANLIAKPLDNGTFSSSLPLANDSQPSHPSLFSFLNFSKASSSHLLKLEANKNNREHEKFIRLSNNKALMEYNFKVKHSGALEHYKDTNSLSYKTLSVEDKKLIDNLNFIDLNSSFPKEDPAISKPFSPSKSNIKTNTNVKTNTNLIGSIEEKKNLIMTKKSFIRSINPFNSKLAQSNNIMFNFNKKNTYNIFKNEKNIGAILEAAFLSMESLISKAYFSVKPDSILINLFFFWKPSFKATVLRKFYFRGRLKIRQFKKFKNKIYYSKKFSKFAIIFEKNLKSLSFILTKLLKKRVNFQFTRIYYPYNDSNIFAFLIGFLSFFMKFNKISKHILSKIIFRIRRRRFFRLKHRNIPSVIRGMNIKLAGRISKTRSNRRVRSMKWQLGSLARSNNNLKVKNRFTNKNRAGIFTININNNAIVFN